MCACYQIFVDCEIQKPRRIVTLLIHVRMNGTTVSKVSGGFGGNKLRSTILRFLRLDHVTTQSNDILSYEQTGRTSTNWMHLRSIHDGNDVCFVN